jgi:hypothetical protein
LDGLVFILLKKKFPVELVRLISDMTHNKKFFVAHNGRNSDLYEILEGLQQGTVNSPLLFSLFTSDILNSFNLNTGNNTYSIAYADDLIVYVAGTYITTIREILQDLVNRINNYYAMWNLRMNPSKCETILFTNPRCNLSTKKAEGRNTFLIKTRVPGTNEEVQIPTKDSVRYLGFTIDHLARGTQHIDLQLKKANSSQQALSRLFSNQLIGKKAKIICYQLFVRSLLTYAAPMWWNMGAAHMEKLRCFERNCIRAALGMYRSASTNYKHRISNKIIYDTTGITRIDCFILKLTRDYLAKLGSIDNKTINSLANIDVAQAKTAALMGYIRPQDFIYHDKNGIIQDGNGVPIIYHWSRNKANKRLPLSYNIIKDSELKYSKTIPEIDRMDFRRLSDKYWWLDDRAVHIAELTARQKIVKRKKQFDQRIE